MAKFPKGNRTKLKVYLAGYFALLLVAIFTLAGKVGACYILGPISVVILGYFIYIYSYHKRGARKNFKVLSIEGNGYVEGEQSNNVCGV